jgi:hypothetical protein
MLNFTEFRDQAHEQMIRENRLHQSQYTAVLDRFSNLGLAFCLMQIKRREAVESR